jgi:rhamnopyranosyl-N-acetylglucosaminyl-diphospho-decaprenol beta-1,3/1,4-galactofuranosyltransferase
LAAVVDAQATSPAPRDEAMVPLQRRSPSANACLTVAVVVTHDRPKLLVESLAAVAVQTRRADRLVVVDNAGDAETREAIAATQGVDVVRSEVNVGGAGGFALGIARAMALGADWIWLMDDDAIPDQSSLAALHAGMAQLPGRVGAVCGTVMEFGEIATHHRRRYNALVGFERRLGAREYASGPQRVDTASFVGFLLSADAIRAVGLPNADLFLSYDDTEYSLRLRRQGFALWLVPESIVLHKRTRAGRLRASVFGARHYYNVRNRIFVKRTYSRFGRIGAALGAAFGIALWIRSPGRLSARAWRCLTHAVADGYAARLGPFPESLEGRPAR